MSFACDLSVVIPAWNEAARLAQTIELVADALRANDAQGLEWEIIVCDNGSTDDTARIARRSGAHVVTEPARGIAHARNAGARAARGEWLLFIDADTHPSPELLSGVRALVGKGAIVGGGATMKPSGGTWWMQFKIQRDNFVLSLLGLAPGVFLFCRHEAFRAIDGFNGDLPALEELGFVLRLRAYGRRRGLAFRVLHRHPVLTSARTKGGMLTMLSSYVLAPVLFLLNTLLPRRLRIRSGWKLLSFWYGSRR